MSKETNRQVTVSYLTEKHHVREKVVLERKEIEREKVKRETEKEKKRENLTRVGGK